ncbi:sulfurtransferase [Brevundimonas sp. 2R-24]|uniref:Sulfurtransferase n=1 Tax=Peiella sedimenti TaxID=3061083 RepID=A0ABT8SLW8_9CAUL|nr:sulfurtransferase [Caulobacteraceae bacterium XZ-24]
MPGAVDPVIAADELKARLGEPALRVLDASWSVAEGALETAHRQARIPGAAFFDIDAVAEQDSPLPHVFPSAPTFQAHARRLGVNDGDEVVVYDQQGLFSAARAWFCFKAMSGCARVLDGGLPAWREAGGVLETGAADPTAGDFTARPRPELLIDRGGLRTAVAEGAIQWIDARPAPRFRGEAPEPRAGLRSGHGPGAVNLPFSDLIDHDRLRPAGALRSRVEAAGIDLARPVAVSCGSGVTACIVLLALERLGVEGRLYDGSWAEWASSPDAEIVTG